jgi:multiple antibiotic resistance protein
MSLFSIALSLFLLMDPIGNIPFYISFLKGVDPKRQRKIILRELLIALVIIILFNFVGDGLMKLLRIQEDTIQIAGGIILFLLCLKMIFPPSHDSTENLPHTAAEPFIVPLAVPLVAGPGVLAAVMIYTRQQANQWVMVGAILIAWIASLLILLASSWLKNILGWRGILAMERLMGLILTLIAVEMFLSGISTFTTNLRNVTPPL